MYLGASKSQGPSQGVDLNYLRGQRRAEPTGCSQGGGVEPPNPTQRTRKPGRGRAVRTGRGKQQQSDFGEVPPKPYSALPGGKPEVSTTASTASLACFWFPHLPASYFLYLAPRINFLLVWPDADRGEALKGPRGHHASASGRVGEGPERAHACMGPAPLPRRP